jgi:hypothetical protein
VSESIASAEAKVTFELDATETELLEEFGVLLAAEYPSQVGLTNA